mmetsp:Transcript_36729/g.77972  ORF Transcript_36729/g.77972 Transcript_36729/m.77972 type:complete len:362 (+) Transcript_36729:3-1088(+)
MTNIEQVAARVPYMVSHGNHEDADIHLAHFIERFRHQPSNADPPLFNTTNGETTNTLYFSWDYGLVHYVSISTELWFGVTDGKTTLKTMLSWLEKDLQAANNNRDFAPWIIVQGHRSVYCSSGADCASTKVRADLEPLLFKYGVDIFMNGHEHNYERSFPLYQNKSDRSTVNPKATIYAVSGAAGSREMHEPFTRKQPSWSAFRSNTFGYTVLTVCNYTHLHWQQVSTDPTSFPLANYGAVIDDVWIVQHSHGPFSLEAAPKGEAYPEGGDNPIRQIDHWQPLLGLGGDGQRMEDSVAEFRDQHGDAAWVEKLCMLQDWAEVNLGGPMTWKGRSNVEWEDVREDGSSDGAAFAWESRETLV